MMELKFASAAKPSKLQPEVVRRQKLVSKIDQQISIARQLTDGKATRRAWFWIGENGTYYLPINYGRHHLELKKGKFSVECPDRVSLEHALCAIRSMVLEGEFDSQLEDIAKRIRKNFSKP